MNTAQSSQIISFISMFTRQGGWINTVNNSTAKEMLLMRQSKYYRNIITSYWVVPPMNFIFLLP